jgi:hypothetical protein
MDLNQIEKKKRYQKQKRIIEEAKTEAIENMQKIIDRGLSSQMELVMLLVLHDKFGFGPERCAKALVAFEQLWADVGDKHLCLDDIEEVVKAEIGIEMTEDTIFQTDKKGNKKLLWSNENT